MADTIDVLIPNGEEKTVSVSTKELSDSENVVTSFIGVKNISSEAGSDGKYTGDGYTYTLAADEDNILSNYTYTKTINPSTTSSVLKKVYDQYPPATLTTDLQDIRETISSNTANIKLNDLRIDDLEAWQAKSGTLTVGDLKEALYGDVTDTSKDGDFSQLSKAIQEMFNNFFKMMIDDDSTVAESNYSTYLPQLQYSFDTVGDGYGVFEASTAEPNSTIEDTDSYYKTWAVRPGATDAKGIINGEIICEDSIPLNRLDGWSTGEWLTNIGSDMIPPTKIFPVGVNSHMGSLDAETRKITDLYGYEDGSVTSFGIDELIGDGAITGTQIANKTIGKEKLSFSLGDDDIARTINTISIPDEKIAGVMKQDARDVFCGDLFLNTADKYFWKYHDYRTILGKGNYLYNHKDGQTVLGQFNRPTDTPYPLTIGGGTGTQDNLKISVDKTTITFKDEYDSNNLKNGDFYYEITMTIYGYDAEDTANPATDSIASSTSADISEEQIIVTVSSSGVVVTKTVYLKVNNQDVTSTLKSLMTQGGTESIMLNTNADIEADIDMIQKVIINNIKVVPQNSSGNWSFSLEDNGEGKVNQVTSFAPEYTIWKDRYYVFNVFRVTSRKNIFTVDYNGNVTATGKISAAGFSNGTTNLMQSGTSVTVGHAANKGVDCYVSGFYYLDGDASKLAFSIPIKEFLPFTPATINVNNLNITVRMEQYGIPYVGNDHLSGFSCTDSSNSNHFSNTKTSSWVAYEPDSGTVRIILPFKHKFKATRGGSYINKKNLVCAINVRGFGFTFKNS